MLELFLKIMLTVFLWLKSNHKSIIVENLEKQIVIVNVLSCNFIPVDTVCVKGAPNFLLKNGWKRFCIMIAKLTQF